MKTYAHKTLYKYRQNGLSLVELMVAITIGLILMAGVGQIFLSSKASYNIQNGMGRLQENARFAMDILSRNIGMAGYDPTEDGSIIQAFNEANTLQGAGTASDTIEINYTSDTDCLNVATGGLATDRYYINGTDLMCRGTGGGAEIMAEGIENMQILYGEDTDGDDVVNLYVNAGNVTDWSDIKTVRIALLVSSNESAGATDNNTYALLNAPPIGPVGDAQLRRVFTQTIVLRNYRP